jgi:hypothetical protein
MYNLLAGQGSHIDTTTTVTVTGQQALAGFLTTDPDNIEFPEGVVLTIQGPDGTVYNTQSNSSTQAIVTSGQSLRLLALWNPRDGEYRLAISAPAGVPFFFQVETIPSDNVIDAVDSAFEPLRVRAAQDVRLARRLGGGVSRGTGVPYQLVGGIAWRLAWTITGYAAKLTLKEVILILAALRFLYEVYRWLFSGKGRRPPRDNPPANPQPPATPESNQSSEANGSDLVRWFVESAADRRTPSQDIDKVLDNIGNGGFVAEMVRNNDFRTYQTFTSYDTFIQFVYTQHDHTLPDTDANTFVVRITYRDPGDDQGVGQLQQSPWIMVRRNDLYLIRLNHWTWNRLDPAHPFVRLSDNAINYPGRLSDPHVNRATILATMRNIDAWTQATPTGSPDPPHRDIDIPALVIAEAARFELVQLFVDDVLDGTLNRSIDTEIANWNDLYYLLRRWDSITNQTFVIVGLVDSWNWVVDRLTTLSGQGNFTLENPEVVRMFNLQDLHLAFNRNLPSQTGKAAVSRPPSMRLKPRLTQPDAVPTTSASPKPYG